MKQRGYLEGSRMANAFNMLRPNDLIWPYVINNYLKGQAPFPFDLLYWNSDSTRMPAANHSFYLRNCYLENRLTKGEMVLDNVKLDLKKVKIPIFNLAARRTTSPRRAPSSSARRPSAARSTTCWPAPATSPASSTRLAKPKYQFWTGGPPKGEFEDWIAKAHGAPRLLVAVLVRLGREAGARSASRPASPAAASSPRSATRRANT